MKSQTLGGDGMHTQGVVLGEIVKANIPVRNGVVHLIHRPLVIVDTTVVQFLEVSSLTLHQSYGSDCSPVILSADQLG